MKTVCDVCGALGFHSCPSPPPVAHGRKGSAGDVATLQPTPRSELHIKHGLPTIDFEAVKGWGVLRMEPSDDGAWVTLGPADDELSVGHLSFDGAALKRLRAAIDVMLQAIEERST